MGCVLLRLAGGDGADPEAHAELRITNERLTADNTALTRQIAELRRLVTVLEGDLAASRQAHAEDVLALSHEDQGVVPFIRPQAELQG